MPIEFHCTQCNRLLRTPDNSVGKQAKCPDCGTILTVPSGATEAPQEPLDTAPPVVETGNPYQAPVMRTAVESSPPPGVPPTTIDFSDILGRTWTVLKLKMGIAIGAGVILLIANFGISMISNLILNVSDVRDPVVRGVLNYVITLLPNTFFTVGSVIFFLNLARGKSPDLADLFKGGPRLIPTTIVLFLYTLAVYAGCILLIVPGIIVGMMFSQAMIFTIDRNAGVTEAFGLSKSVTTGNKLTLFAIYLVVGILGVLFILFTCGLGILLYMPYIWTLVAMVYLAMTGERTAEQLST